jgi:hypothetical protein
MKVQFYFTLECCNSMVNTSFQSSGASIFWIYESTDSRNVRTKLLINKFRFIRLFKNKNKCKSFRWMVRVFLCISYYAMKTCRGVEIKFDLFLTFALEIRLLSLGWEKAPGNHNIGRWADSRWTSDEVKHPCRESNPGRGHHFTCWCR